MKSWTFTLYADPGKASPNLRIHYMARWRVSQMLRKHARMVWVAAGMPRAGCPVVLHFTVHRGRRMDDDNLIAALKPIRDGLCTLALTPDDSPAWVSLGTVTQVSGRKYARAPMMSVRAECTSPNEKR